MKTMDFSLKLSVAPHFVIPAEAEIQRFVLRPGPSPPVDTMTLDPLASADLDHTIVPDIASLDAQLVDTDDTDLI